MKRAQPEIATNGSLRVENTYDYLKRRVAKQVSMLTGYEPPSGSPPSFGNPGEWISMRTTKFVWDGMNIAAEIIVDESTGTTNVTRYVWGLDLSGSVQGAGGVGGLLAEIRDDGSMFFPYYDANGNITDYVDVYGTVHGQFEYDAFGTTVAMSGDLAHTFHFRFSTKYHDDETGLDMFQLRPCIPPLARWASRDPIGESGGDNLYGLVLNNSPNRYDFLGLKCESLNRNDFEKWLFSKGVLVDDTQRARLDNGCVGVACVMMHHDDLPESQSDTTCWLSETLAKNDCQRCKKFRWKSCCTVWAKQGRWTTVNGKAPKPDAKGRVPCKSVGSIDPKAASVWNYVTLIAGYYVNANHAKKYGAQEFYVCDTPPSSEDYDATIWGATCVTTMIK